MQKVCSTSKMDFNQSGRMAGAYFWGTITMPSGPHREDQILCGDYSGEEEVCTVSITLLLHESGPQHKQNFEAPMHTHIGTITHQLRGIFLWIDHTPNFQGTVPAAMLSHLLSPLWAQLPDSTTTERKGNSARGWLLWGMFWWDHYVGRACTLCFLSAPLVMYVTKCEYRSNDHNWFAAVDIWHSSNNWWS